MLYYGYNITVHKSPQQGLDSPRVTLEVGKEVWNSLGIRTKNDNFDCNLWTHTSKPTQTLCDHRERHREESS